MIQANRDLALGSGLVFALPIPRAHALDSRMIHHAIEQALLELAHLQQHPNNNNMTATPMGKETTPFLLRRVYERTAGQSLAASTYRPVRGGRGNGGI